MDKRIKAGWLAGAALVWIGSVPAGAQVAWDGGAVMHAPAPIDLAGLDKLEIELEKLKPIEALPVESMPVEASPVRTGAGGDSPAGLKALGDKVYVVVDAVNGTQTRLENGYKDQACADLDGLPKIRRKMVEFESRLDRAGVETRELSRPQVNVMHQLIDAFQAYCSNPELKEEDGIVIARTMDQSLKNIYTGLVLRSGQVAQY